MGKTFFWCIGSSILLAVISFVLLIFDKNFSFVWINFWIHNLSIVLVFLPFLHLFKKSYLLKKESYPLLLVIFVSGFLSFIFLENYPFVSLGHEVRDGGLYAQQFATGALRDVFGYGSYTAQGNIVSVINSFFYLVFKDTVFTFRVPNAILAVLDVTLIYLLLRLKLNKLSAFIGSMVFLTFPLHLLFARTETVLIFDSFWTTIILLSVYLLSQKKTPGFYVLTGTILGIATNFHTSSRIISLLSFLFIFGFSVYYIFNSKLKKKFIYSLILLITFFIVGSGPMLLKSTPSTFLQVERLNQNYNYKNPSAFNYQALQNNYLKSLKVWVYESSSSRYPIPQPLLNPFFAILFLAGIASSFFVFKNIFLRYATALVLILPLTNSAITDQINADHRLAPFLSVAAIFIALGFHFLYNLFRSTTSKRLFTGVVMVMIFLQGFQFFYRMPLNKNGTSRDYLSMNLIYFLKNYDGNYLGGNLCAEVSKINASKFNLIDYNEQYKYFLPGTAVDFKINSNLKDNQVYLKKDCEEKPQNWKGKIISCSSKNKNFNCPLDYTGTLEIYY